MSLWLTMDIALPTEIHRYTINHGLVSSTGDGREFKGHCREAEKELRIEELPCSNASDHFARNH